MDEERTSIIPRDEVHILVTEEDKTGEDILAMSDFFDGYVQQLTEAIRTNAVTTYVPSIPIADIGIIGEVVQRVEVIKLPAIAVSGPFGAVKEQSSGLYAQKMVELGFLTIAFDPSYTGESGGTPRYVASPDINTEDFCAAVDFFCKEIKN